MTEYFCSCDECHPEFHYGEQEPDNLPEHKYPRTMHWFNLGDDFTVLECCRISDRQEHHVPHYHDGLPF